MSAPYVVRDRRALTSLLAAFLLSFVVAGGLALFTGQWLASTVAVVVVGYLTLVRLRAAAERLRVDAAGISVSAPEARLRPGSRRYVPWAAVREVDVDGDLLVVRLRPDAPMPMWMKGRVVDPAHPEAAGELRERVPGLDGAELRRVVTGLGVTVPVIVR